MKKKKKKKKRQSEWKREEENYKKKKKSQSRVDTFIPNPPRRPPTKIFFYICWTSAVKKLEI